MQCVHPEHHPVECIFPRRVGQKCKKKLVKYFQHSGLQNSLKKSLERSIETPWIPCCNSMRSLHYCWPIISMKELCRSMQIPCSSSYSRMLPITLSPTTTLPAHHLCCLTVVMFSIESEEIFISNSLTPASVHMAREERDSCCAASSVLSVCPSAVSVSFRATTLSVLHLFFIAWENGHVEWKRVKSVSCMSLQCVRFSSPD